MIVLTLARKPLTQTVARTALASGTGAINIDAARIGSGTVKQATAGRRTVKWGVAMGESTYEKGTGAVFSTEGRWPANVVFEHRPECRCLGTEEVKGNRTDTRPEGDAGRADKTQWRFRPTEATKRGYSNEDGTETVVKWACAPGCAVAELDAQTREPDDSTGGASRFFRVFGGTTCS